ncbi:MAG TPA: HD domain-containing protein [Gemmatimonadota bacterium]|nr:HD domain-containing protein [Gemmatimonadota bacterium]
MIETYRKQVFCADLKIGQEVSEVFCVGRVQRRMGRNGPFLTLEFVDRSGRIPGVAWDEVDALAERLVEGGYAKVGGRVTDFRGEPQIQVVEAIEAPTALEPSEYLPVGPVPPERSIEGIRRLARTIADDGLRRLVVGFLDDPGFLRRFEAAPAAKLHHHAYVGGLAEHTLSVMGLCADLADHYRDLDRDLLLTGAFCHDLGKVRELAIEPGFPYTEEGQLVGHIVLGYEMVRDRAREAGLSAERAVDLGHLVLSHQGEHQWGSPVEPRTLEALVLHFLDNLDSKVASARPHLAGIESGRTNYIRSLGRSLFRRGTKEGQPPARPGNGPDRSTAP